MTSQVISVTASSSPLTKTTSFITSLISSNTQKSQPLSLKQNDRKWRWWNILSVVILLLVLFEIIILCTSYSILSSEKPLVTIVKRQYPTMKYTHLDTDIQSKIEKDTRVYHVTKEFGPAAISDLGRYVTGLATAQQASELTDVAVVMPLYPFMRRLAPTLEIEMMIEMRGKHLGEKAALEFRVYKAMYAFNPPLQAPAKRVWQMINNVNTSVNLTPQREPAKRDAIPVYMISQANKFPFNKAFKHRTPEEINDEHPDFPNDWQDQYFAKAATAFLAYKANAADEESIFAPIRVVPRVDIVHIHGASNAYVAKFLQDKKEADDLGPRPPAIVYTVHDHQAEMKYCNSFRSVRKFLDHPGDREKLHKYVYGGRMFMSKVAIDHAEAVTFVDHALAADVLEGRRDFHLKELVMDSLLRKAQGSRFFGINQAIDYHSTDHPFITDKLANKSMAYPKYALDMIHDQPSLQSVDPSQPLTLVAPETPTYWTLPELSKDFVSVYKDRARRYLIRRSLLKEADMRRPVVLFRDALAYNAGVESLAYAAQLFAEQNMKLIIMGSRADYPFEEIKAIETRYPEHIKVVSDVKDVRRYGTLCRAAADFVFVPTVHEDDLGLQTVGGLVYGSAVISTGAGRLHAALIDRGDVRGNVHVDYPDSTKTENGATVTSYEYYNAYLYNHTSKDSLKQAISDAASDYNQLIRNNKALREEFILRMIRSAISLAWDKGHFQGPMHEYNQVYQLVLQDRLIPRMRMHEVEQEDELVSRLRDSTDDPFKWN